MQCEYRTMAAFAISAVVNKYPMGQVIIFLPVFKNVCLACLSPPLAC